MDLLIDPLGGLEETDADDEIAPLPLTAFTGTEY